MGPYILSRLARTIPVIAIVSVLVFGMVGLLPGDPVLYMFQGAAISAETIAKARHLLGLDLPVYVRYVQWLSRVLLGNLGFSIFSNRSVTELIATSFPETLKLTVLSVGIALAFGLSAGIAAAVRQNSWVDSISMFVATLGLSMPLFSLGLLLLYLFAVRLAWFPVAAGYSWVGLVLPGFTLGIRSSCLIARLTRSSMLEVLHQDYVRTAWAKGLGGRIVLTKHALRNALIPVITVVGLQIGWMLGGAVIVETIFARPGMGRLAVEAIETKDFPVVQGAILVSSVVYVLINLTVDVLYAYLDPRVHYA